MAAPLFRAGAAVIGVSVPVSLPDGQPCYSRGGTKLAEPFAN